MKSTTVQTLVPKLGFDICIVVDVVIFTNALVQPSRIQTFAFDNATVQDRRRQGFLLFWTTHFLFLLLALLIGRN